MGVDCIEPQKLCAERQGIRQSSIERYLAKISKGGQEDLEDCGLDMARTVTPAPGAAGPSALAVDGGA